MGGIRIFLRIIICCFGILSIIVIGFRSNNGICLIRCIICCAVLRSYCRICYCCISGFCWVLWWIGWNCCIWFRGISSLIINRNWNIWCRVWFWKNCVIFWWWDRLRILMRLINQQICKMKVINSKMPDSQSLRKVKHFRKSNKKKLVLSKIKVKHYLIEIRRYLLNLKIVWKQLQTILP